MGAQITRGRAHLTTVGSKACGFLLFWSALRSEIGRPFLLSLSPKKRYEVS